MTGNEMTIMGEWSVPRMECWLTVGRADRGLGPELGIRVDAVVMGTVKWRWEARWNNFIDHLTVHIYKHNIPSPCWKISRYSDSRAVTSLVIARIEMSRKS